MLVCKPLEFWREALAEFLYGAGFQVSIVNPARMKGFAKSELLRTQTDSVDAALIARFCAAMKPSLWTPTAPEVKELQALLRRLESVAEMMTSEENRLETATSTVAALTLAHLDYLKQQQQLIKKRYRILQSQFLKSSQPQPTRIANSAGSFAACIARPSLLPRHS